MPFPAGGGTDALARFLSHGLEQRLGQPFIIENRGGAGTTLGATLVARSAPDGYTIMVGTSSTFASRRASTRSWPTIRPRISRRSC